MNFIIESVLGIVVLYFTQILLGLIVPSLFMPITILTAFLEKKIRGGYLPIYNTFRFDHFINFMVIGISSIFLANYLLKLLPWSYELNLSAIIFIALIKRSSYNQENGFWYEVSIIGGGILGSLFGYLFFIL